MFSLFKKKRTFLSSSEFVSNGHPDRLSDLMAARVIDDIQKKDGWKSHAAIEVFLTHNSVTFAGEATTTMKIDRSYLRKVVKDSFYRAGYIPEMRKFWTKDEVCLPSNLTIYNKISPQSPDIALGTTDKAQETGYNDQGIAMSSSENTTHTKLGMPHLLAMEISKRLSEYSLKSIRESKSYYIQLGPDNKVVVTLEVQEDGFTPICVKGVTVAVAHSSESNTNKVYMLVKSICIQVFAEYNIPMAQPAVNWVINGTGRFVIHGNISDCSMTGRKLSVNNPSAGPLWSNKLLGGGALVKPYHASDLILNVASRFVSNIIVEAGLSSYAVTLVSCSIGMSHPQSVQIIGDERFMRKYYDKCQYYFTHMMTWSIGGLVDYLHILKPEFSFFECVANNFFGDPNSQPWENPKYIEPMVRDLLNYLDR